MDQNHPPASSTNQGPANVARKGQASEMVWIPGGTFLMGSNRHYPEEAPAHKVTVDGFWMEAHTVTNEEFGRFVDETGHVTLAEKPARAEDYPGAAPELLEPSSVVFKKPTVPVDMRNVYNWWIYVKGANWRQPRGPGSTIEGSANIPSCRWASKTPTPTRDGPP